MHTTTIVNCTWIDASQWINFTRLLSHCLSYCFHHLSTGSWQLPLLITIYPSTIYYIIKAAFHDSIRWLCFSSIEFYLCLSPLLQSIPYWQSIPARSILIEFYCLFYNEPLNSQVICWCGTMQYNTCTSIHNISFYYLKPAAPIDPDIADRCAPLIKCRKRIKLASNGPIVLSTTEWTDSACTLLCDGWWPAVICLDTHRRHLIEWRI